MIRKQGQKRTNNRIFFSKTSIAKKKQGRPVCVITIKLLYSRLLLAAQPSRLNVTKEIITVNLEKKCTQRVRESDIRFS